MLSLKGAEQEFWLQLGEASSKCEHLAGTPLSPGVAEELNKIFLVKGVLATTAIEGNTLSVEQVLQQVDGELELPPSQEYLKQEVQNILDVCNEEIRAIQDPNKDRRLCKKIIESYNKKILYKLKVDKGVVPGKLRSHSVVVGNVYRGAPAENCEYLLDRLCEWLNGPAFVAPKADLVIPYAMLKAIVAHIYLAWIHPFGDGNGRTARLMEFHILFSSGVPLPAAHLLSDHYNLTRTQYYRELDGASKSGGKLIPFIQYAIEGFLDGLRGQIEEIKRHQMGVAWENYVHNHFRDKKLTVTQKRRRDLVLELSSHGWVAVTDIDELSATLARAYAGAGSRMIQRDLNAVHKMGLISRDYGRVLANKHIMEAFRPVKVQENNAE